MATVHVPAPLRGLCGGAARLDVAGATLVELLREVDQRCPGFFARVVEDGRLRPEISVAIDGDAAPVPLHEPIAPGAEVTIIPAIAGGAFRTYRKIATAASEA